MEYAKDARWRQRFENFERSYKLLKKYSGENIKTELERAGIIQFFERTFELSWKLLKDYLETQGYYVKSPREAIKTAFQFRFVDNGHVWLEALTKQNQTTHSYDETLAKAFVEEIDQKYLPMIHDLYEKLVKE